MQRESKERARPIFDIRLHYATQATGWSMAVVDTAAPALGEEYGKANGFRTAEARLAQLASATWPSAAAAFAEAVSARGAH